MEEDGGSRFASMEMTTALTGSITVPVSVSDAQVFLVVASVPDNFGSYQTYGYKVGIIKV